MLKWEQEISSSEDSEDDDIAIPNPRNAIFQNLRNAIFQKGGGYKFFDLDITDDDVRPTLISLSNLALETYHQNNNQGPTFVFHQHVQCCYPLGIAGMLYFITFQAKAEEEVPSNNPAAITNFQAEVLKKLGDGPPEVRKCAIKI